MKKIFGHRGLPLTYMENSITSLNAALEYCDYVETDVRITADSNLILFHDPDLNERFIKELTTEEILSQLDNVKKDELILSSSCLLYTSPSPRDLKLSRMPSSA